MNKTKSTKRALLMSALALLLCVSMLIGSTYAWFTDTAVSKNNKIVAGNLEVDLIMWNGTKYESIADQDAAIFGAGSLAQNVAEETLWEPGKTQIVYLGVENKGSLDLKYNILLNVIDGGLIGSLEYAIVDGATNETTLPADWAALKNLAQTGEIVAGTTVAAPNGAIKAGTDAVDYFALAVHMKEEAGNQYQDKDVTIDVTVAATQLASEEDTFGPTYDEKATFLNKDEDGNWLISSPAELVYFATSVNGGKNYKDEIVKLTADIDMAGYGWTPIKSFGGTFDGNGKVISNLTVSGESKVAFFSGINSTAKIMNVTFDKANVSGNHYVGVVVGYEGNENANALIKNVKVTNSTVTCTVADNDNGDKVGGIAGYAVSLNIENCAVENSTITGYRDVGGIIGYAHKYMVVKNNTVKDSVLICDASVNYKNYTRADEYDVEAIVGEAVATAVTSGNTFTNVNVVVPEDVVGTFEELKTALDNGESKINIAGNIVLESGLNASNVTFIGVTDDAAIDFAGHNIAGNGTGTITYENLSLSTVALSEENGERSGWHGGIDYVRHATANYIGCDITGVFTTYSETVNATSCTFNSYVQDGEEYYNIFMYVPGTVNVTDCTFMYRDRAIKVFKEGSGGDFVLNLKESKFVATDDYTVNKPLINVDSTYLNSVTVNIDGIEIDTKLASVAIHNTDSKLTVTGIN